MTMNPSAARALNDYRRQRHANDPELDQESKLHLMEIDFEMLSNVSWLCEFRGYVEAQAVIEDLMTILEVEIEGMRHLVSEHPQARNLETSIDPATGERFWLCTTCGETGSGELESD